MNFGFHYSLPNIIKVIGVGGAGCNAVNHMFRMGVHEVDFVVCNTDIQSLGTSPVPLKVELGASLNGGRGAGNMPELGEQSAIESMDALKQILEDSTRMLFITAGMGGGTGTGATPVIAKLAKDLGILTIAVVTLPSPVEGKRRYNQALEGVEKLRTAVDSILVIRNEKLHTVYGDLTASQAFSKADDVLATTVKGIAELITLNGNINIDFSDVYTVMKRSGTFIMGTGYAEGEGRAVKAAKMAIEFPLLENNDLTGAKNILINIISGEDEVKMAEIGIILEFMQQSAGMEADIIWGNSIDKNLGKKICIAILATGFKKDQFSSPSKKEVIKETMTDTLGLIKKDDHLILQEEKPNRDREADEEVIFEIDRPTSENKASQYNSEQYNKQHKDNKAESLTDNWFLRQFNTLFEENETE
ncbi:MAG: cell division protein FtsZ [Bacteroidota bacterium]|nr:cell division protein FtsZ [Bacteroidota bacterium]